MNLRLNRPLRARPGDAYLKSEATPGAGVNPRSPRAMTASRPPFSSRSSACRAFALIDLGGVEERIQLLAASRQYTGHLWILSPVIKLFGVGWNRRVEGVLPHSGRTCSGRLESCKHLCWTRSRDIRTDTVRSGRSPLAIAISEWPGSDSSTPANDPPVHSRIVGNASTWLTGSVTTCDRKTRSSANRRHARDLFVHRRLAP